MLELKTILICSLVEEQLQLWRELLSSQGYQLMLPEPETNLVKLLDQAPIDNLPDLVVIDLGLKIPDTSALQSSTVARWCRENQPQIKVVFTNPKEDEVLSLEYRWALRQGAISLLPKLNAQNLLSSVKQISVALGTRIGEEALQNFVNFLQPNIVEESAPVTSPEIAVHAATSYFTQALTQYKAGNLELAANELGIAIRINPNYAAAYVLRGDIYISLSQFQRALNDYNQAITIYPQNAEVWWRRGNMYFKLGETQAAIAEFNQGLKFNPKFAELYNSRGLARFHSGDESGALKDYDQAIKLKPTLAEAYCHRGMLRYSTSNANAALKDYDQAIKHHPQYAEAYYNRGNVRSDAGAWEKAIADYTESIRHNPKFALAYGNRGIAYYQIDNVAEAITDTETAANIFRDQGDTKAYRRALETIEQIR